jgi:hypothetical protein
VERAERLRREHAMRGLVRLVDHRRRMQDAGGVDHAVQRAEAPSRERERALDVVAERDVGLHDLDFRAARAQREHAGERRGHAVVALRALDPRVLGRRIPRRGQHESRAAQVVQRAGEQEARGRRSRRDQHDAVLAESRPRLGQVRQRVQRLLVALARAQAGDRAGARGAGLVDHRVDEPLRRGPSSAGTSTRRMPRSGARPGCRASCRPARPSPHGAARARRRAA